MNYKSISILCLVFLLSGCAVVRGGGERSAGSIMELARSETRWTGIAISDQGRIFVNYPRWTEEEHIAVAELMADGTPVPFPNEHWNALGEDASVKDRFVCVQSVYIDAKDSLWILDPANPEFKGVVPDGPKLLKVDLSTNDVVKTYRFDDSVLEKDSYLNDIRVDTKRDIAYISDSGVGAILVLDLNSSKVRRLLADDYSTKSEGLQLTIEGQAWRLPNGQQPRIHVDGIALDPSGEFLYYQALTGKSLYRIGTRHLRNEELSARELAEKVEFVVKAGASDGIIFGGDGQLYLTSLEHNAIRRVNPPGKDVEMVVQDPRLSWPDSMSVGPDSALYVTTAHIHRFNDNKQPFRIFRIVP